MLHVNLLPWRTVLHQRRRRFWLRQITVAVTLSLFIMLAGAWLVNHAIAVQRAASHSLKVMQARLFSQQQKVVEAKAQLQVLQLAADQHQRRYEHSTAYLTLLASLSRHIPASVWLTKLTEGSEGRIRLHGETSLYHSALVFAQSLRRDALFSEVSVLDIQRLPNHRLRFVMQISLAR